MNIENLATGEYDDQLDVLFAAERAGKSRKKVLAALADRAMALVAVRREAQPEAPEAPSAGSKAMVIARTRSPWTFGPLMGTKKDDDGKLWPVVLDDTVIRLPALDPKDPAAAQIEVDGSRWHKYATSDQYRAAIEGLVKNGEIAVVGSAA